MTRALIVGAICTALLCAALGVKRAMAQSAASPSKMERMDVLELENASIKLETLQRQAQPLIERRAKILDQYHLGKNDSVNFATGEITREKVRP